MYQSLNMQKRNFFKIEKYSYFHSIVKTHKNKCVLVSQDKNKLKLNFRSVLARISLFSQSFMGSYIDDLFLNSKDVNLWECIKNQQFKFRLISRDKGFTFLWKFKVRFLSSEECKIQWYKNNLHLKIKH